MTNLSRSITCRVLAWLMVAAVLPSCDLRPDPDTDFHGAWAYSQLFVMQRLKAPATAKFPFGGAQGVTPLGGGRYRVSSHVDSQNGFGAMLRKNFKLVIKRTDGGWELESLRFGS